MNEWKSVEKELPPNGKLVLVLSKAFLPMLDGVLNQKPRQWIFMGSFTRSIGWIVYFRESSADVTHWMEMPELPI